MESSVSSNTPFEGNTKNIPKLGQAPGKAHEVQSDQSSQGELKKLEPEWLERFFEKNFFVPCKEHPVRQNLLNKYCIDCDASLCQFCMSLAPHEDHRLLKIYRHVYKDVVPLDEIEQHIDCSEIQPYRCNKQMVIALTPLPHSGSKTSDDEATCQICKRKLIEYNFYSYCSISCKVKAFTKKDDDNKPPFLSLDQPVQNAKQGCELKKTVVDEPVQKPNQESELKTTTVYQSMQNEEIDLNKTPDQLAENAKQESGSKMMDLEPPVHKANPEQKLSYRTRKRKGIPHRAPFF